ncbi:MAG: alkaline phosphatase family protein, partial [Candidatus Didemnitutus sp.]|nr:alkaline phosphatase family protein [Candidatus Didemnitutus sp.]
MKRFLGVVVAVGLGLTLVRAEKPERPIAAIERVLIISVDGLRPDRLLLADAPVIRGLMAEGAYSMWARTTAMATTLPSHTSMVTAVVPRKHKIYWNEPLPLTEPIYPARPTLFEMARRNGYRTAMVAGKAKFLYLNKPGTIQHASYPAPGEPDLSDAVVAARAAAIITAHRPEVLLVNFPEVDEVGHAKGWGSSEQLAAIARVDGHVATVLAALDAAGVRPSTLIIVTSDHGGSGITHSMDDERSRRIPWIAVGPGLRRN